MKRILLMTVVVAAVIAVGQYFFGWSSLFENLETFARQTGNPWIFFLIMSVGCALGFPLSAAYLYAGIAFGIFYGWGLCMGGLLVSGTLGYILGLFFADGDFANSVCRRLKISSFKNMYTVNFYVRAIPGIPYWTQNIALGAMHSNFKMYTLVNISVQGSIALAMNAIGASILDGGFGKYFIISFLVVAIIIINKIFLHYIS